MNSLRYGAVVAVTGGSARAERLGRLCGDTCENRVERIIRNYISAGVKNIVVVTGAQKKLVRRLKHEGVIFLRMEGENGFELLDYVKLGFGWMKEECDRIFFCPESVPFFTEKTVRAMMDADSPLVIPVFQGKSGHPVLVDSSLVNAISAYEGREGLAGAVRPFKESAFYLETEDPGILSDSGSPESLKKLVKRHDIAILGPEVKSALRGKNAFFGQDTLKLLKQVQRFGNVREACEKSGISYSKGWSLIRSAEEGLGEQIVSRQAGGKDGGSTSVTDRGQKLMELFEEYQAEVERTSEDTFRRLFLDSGFLGS